VNPVLRVKPAETAIACAIALLSGVWFFALFWVVATPKEASSGTSAANRSLDRVDAILARQHGAATFPPGSVCRSTAEAAMQALRQRLATAARTSGVALTSSSATVGAANPATGWLTPIAVRLEADGPYGAALAFAGALAKSQPNLFADTVEIRSKASAAAFILDGHIYCSTYAIP